MVSGRNQVWPDPIAGTSFSTREFGRELDLTKLAAARRLESCPAKSLIAGQ